MTIAVYIERADRRTFACALDWPGFCRSGKTEEAALEALADYVPRYAPVAERAGLRFPKRPTFEVVQRLKGGATTDFGAPEKPAAADKDDLTARQAKRLAAIVQASWDVFDDVAAHAPEKLRKGPRGGGRDTSAIVQHVNDAESSYARMLAIKGIKERDAIRAAVVEAIASARKGEPLREKGWLPRYAARPARQANADSTISSTNVPFSAPCCCKSCSARAR